MEEERARKLGEYIKKERKRRGITAQSLADLAGYSQPYISALENNKNKNVPNKDVLNNIAKGFEKLGYNFKEIQRDLFKIADYVTPEEQWEKYDNENKDLIKEINQYQGLYDNVNDKQLDYPYMNLSYLLEENDFKLVYKYEYRKDEVFSQNIFLNKKQKEFLSSIIQLMLEKDGKADREIEDMMRENQLNYEKYDLEQMIEHDLERYRNLLKDLTDMKNNYSDELFEKTYLKYNVRAGDDFFTKDNFYKYIQYVKKMISESVQKIEKIWQDDDTND